MEEIMFSALVQSLRSVATAILTQNRIEVFVIQIDLVPRLPC